MNESMIPAAIIMGFFSGMGAMGFLLHITIGPGIIAGILFIIFAITVLKAYGGEE